MRITKWIVAKLILLSITPVMAQAGAPQTLALSWFYTPDGSTGIVSLIRQGNPAFTELYYSTCVDTDDSVCQEGSGTIPNYDFAGSVSTSLRPGNTLSLYVDTSAPSFTNWLCLQPNYDLATCDGGTAPATGGIIQASWTKGNNWARITTSADTLYAYGRVNQSASSGDWAFYATMRGTFLGVPMNTTGIVTGEMELMTGSTTGGSTIQTLASRWAKGRTAIAKPGKVGAR